MVDFLENDYEQDRPNHLDPADDDIPLGAMPPKRRPSAAGGRQGRLPNTQQGGGRSHRPAFVHLHVSICIVSSYKIVINLLAK